MRWHLSELSVWGVLLVACAGCSSANPDLVSVAGRVTFNGGNMPARGTVYFLPMSGSVADGQPKRPALAHFREDVMFRATTWRPGDGLRPGSYRVIIECWKEAPSMSSRGISYVDLKYLDPEQSEISLEVRSEDGNLKLAWDVTGPSEPVDLGRTGISEMEMN